MLVPEKPGTKRVRTFAKQSAAQKRVVGTRGKTMPADPIPLHRIPIETRMGFGRFLTGFTSCVPGKQTPFSGDPFDIVAHTKAVICSCLWKLKIENLLFHGFPDRC